jgi:Na+/citrate or Na+/malate symporter
MVAWVLSSPSDRLQTPLLAGLIIGGVVGWILGFSFGRSRINISGLAPMVAGGAGLPAFIYYFFESLLDNQASAFYQFFNHCRRWLDILHQPHTLARQQAH